MSAPLINMTGKRFGSIVFLGVSGKDRFGFVLWLCRCDCGELSHLRAHPFRSGRVKGNCIHRGCRNDHPRRKELQSVWNGMLQRCYNRNNHRYHYYGGRGIKVCERWHTFENFAKDMPPRPKPWGRDWTIDRIDVNGDYELSNVRWATPKEQQNNRQYNVTVPPDKQHLTRQRRQQIANNLRGFCMFHRTTPLAVGSKSLCEICLAKKRSDKYSEPMAVCKCQFMGCDRVAKISGLCFAHYQQQRRWGRLGPIRGKRSNGLTFSKFIPTQEAGQ